MHTQNYPTGIHGETDKFTDVGFDTQYENTMDSGTLVARARWIYESQNLDATLASAPSGAANNLNAFRTDVFYYFMEHYGVDVGYFNTFGTTDATLYQPASVTGSRTGSPDSNGFIGQFDYQPWMNTKFSVQYTLYSKFNGSSHNYDGSGRSAANNNTLYLLAWFAF